MYLMTTRNIEDVANEVAAATHEVCTLLHSQQCKIVEGALHPAVKVETVLQLQHLLLAVHRKGTQQLRIIEGDPLTN